MDTKKYIESGILELYVAGALSAEENKAVTELINTHPELKEEVIKIEKAIMALTSATAPMNARFSFETIKVKIENNTNNSNIKPLETKNNIQEEEVKIIPISTEQNRSNWLMYSGWAASLVLTGGLIWALNNNADLNHQLEQTSTEKTFLQQQISDIGTRLERVSKIVNLLRDKNVISIPLNGQTVSPESYAKVYWNKQQSEVYVDVQGLPTPPKGKAYQVWSLKMSPLTPTSLGVIDDLVLNNDKIIILKNMNSSEAFGITLEPEGGSLTPSLDQLYALGTLASVQ